MPADHRPCAGAGLDVASVGEPLLLRRLAEGRGAAPVQVGAKLAASVVVVSRAAAVTIARQVDQRRQVLKIILWPHLQISLRSICSYNSDGRPRLGVLELRLLRALVAPSVVLS